MKMRILIVVLAAVSLLLSIRATRRTHEIGASLDQCGYYLAREVMASTECGVELISTRQQREGLRDDLKACQQECGSERRP